MVRRQIKTIEVTRASLPWFCFVVVIVYGHWQAARIKSSVRAVYTQLDKERKYVFLISDSKETWKQFFSANQELTVPDDFTPFVLVRGESLPGTP